MVIINCCRYTCRVSWSDAVVASPSLSTASGPGLALPALPLVPPLLFFLSSSSSRIFLSALLLFFETFYLSSLLHLRLVLTASSPLQSCRFLVWLDFFHACLWNVFCLGHQSQHFRGLREVMVCFFLFYYPFSITVLLFHSPPPPSF